jgi:hypothetical protein
MTNRAKGWIAAILISIALWGLIAWAASAAQITIEQMLEQPGKYFPAPCDQRRKVCILTGLGGIVSVWTRHVDTHDAKGFRFVVRGVCASACEIAARRAKATALPGSRLIPHSPSPGIWTRD